jgi:trk system potassium uptake protein
MIQIMKIVIIGAGDIGLHLATIFSQVDYWIVLVDMNPTKLEKVSRELDVATRLGSGVDWRLLKELLEEFAPDLLLALTDDDETNLVSCTIAKNLGYPQTIARARNSQYLLQDQLNFEKIFSVDNLIGPESLTADAIANMILIPGSVATEHFAHGSIQMRTLKVPAQWNKEKVPLKDGQALALPSQMMIGLIRRQVFKEIKGQKTLHEERVIFPHGHDVILPGDEVTCIGEIQSIRSLHKFFGIPLNPPQSVVIVGGSLTGILLAQSLIDHHIRVRILDTDYAKCQRISEKLPQATVINRSGIDYRFLQSEKVEEADVFIACTQNDEINFLAATIARELGCEQVIISLSDINYIPLISKLGITQAASPRICAANRILSIAREQTIASMVSLYGNQAEIVEVKISPRSALTGIPIRSLSKELPVDFLIVMIHSNGKVYIADGDRVLNPGDTIVVITKPRHLYEIKKMF